MRNFTSPTKIRNLLLLTFFGLGLTSNLRAGEEVKQDRRVGMGAQRCFDIRKKFEAFDVARDQEIALTRAVIEKSRLDEDEKVKKFEELTKPVLEKHRQQTEALAGLLREFALGMLQAELLKPKHEDHLLELENFNYVDKFLELCRKDADKADVLYQEFVSQVLDGGHKVQWLRTTR
ncbi:MAG TPA: hypothetical protein VM901_02055 [Bdellovibrionota bacterium]|jgi:hypothetical protein|nr:hypothetical protein [Bdellovibrionota bacterium]